MTDKFSDDTNSRRLEDWGRYLIQRILHPATIFGTPSIIFILLVYFVVTAFMGAMPDGLRSFAGALLPMIIATYIYIYQKDLINNLGKFNSLYSLVGMMALGIGIMIMIKTVGQAFEGLPIKEVVLSSVFSLLVFSYVVLDENKVLSYFYGLVVGFLLYIIFVGLPL